MKTKVTRKVVLMCSAVLLGITVCMSLWLFLREHKTRNFTNNELITERINTGQAKKNTDENQGDEPRHKAPAGGDIAFHLLTLEERVESIAQMAKSNYISMLSEEELARPDIQKWIDVYNSLEYRELIKDMMENSSNFRRKFWDVLESQGISVDRGVFAAVFRKVFPTGEPEDYEPEMRLEMAKLFLAAEPVDLTDPEAAALQRLEVYSKFMKQSDQNFAWLAGRFDADFDAGFDAGLDGVLRTESNPTLEWVRDVQHNAVSIIANAEAAEDPGTDTDPSASSWDLSSVMESPSESSDATTGESQSIFPPVPDGLARPAISKPETDTAVAPGLTNVPKTPTELPTVEGLEASLKEQFSSERFERAMSTLERYGPEEGLRHLRENDPEVASQIEQHRNRFRSEDSDKSEEEVSR